MSVTATRSTTPVMAASQMTLHRDFQVSQFFCNDPFWNVSSVQNTPKALNIASMLNLIAHDFLESEVFEQYHD